MPKPKAKQALSKNLENIRQDNEGGVIAISGFEYQFHFTAQKCLEMLTKPKEITFVSSETHEDVVVCLADGTYEFYQVKSKESEQWYLRDLSTQGVWSNFIKVREKFGNENSFWFVSNQTAKHSVQKGKAKRIPDLGQMKKLTYRGKSICSQDERDKDNVAILLDRLNKDWDFNDRIEADSFFWKIRILTDHEHETGLQSNNILSLQKILEERGIYADSTNLSRIYDLIVNLLRKRVKPPDTATYEEAIELRKIRVEDLEDCISAPYTETRLSNFVFSKTSEEPQKRKLCQKTKDLPGGPNYFIESRNYFAILYRQQLSFAAEYIAHLRHRVWTVCHTNKIQFIDGQKPLKTYQEIVKGLTKLVENEQNKKPPIEVTLDYLHGMMCQLTAECLHDWYPLEE
ncbi:MAG: DUF4297 domain-containing protein [Ardenticatenaceae bacterium]|nr:DUF4297 domain-containing protein [Ardenticatenaceae bacterium]